MKQGTNDLGRTTQVTTSSGDVYTYTYNGEGQLHEIRDNNGTTDTADDVYYRYVYDELGRLVSCVELTKDTDGDPIPSISGIYTYNTDSKLTNFSVQIPGVVDSMSETYTYNTDDTDGVSDGSLTSMSMLSGEDLTYTYDSLSRLTKREVAGILTENYSFLAGSAANTTTTMVSQYQVKDADTNALLHGYSYEYDAVGNITKITENGAGYTDYTYDTVNQLLTAKDYNTAGTLVKEYTYTYDTYGNIRTSSNGTTSHTYTYGDAEWLDLLTAYDGNTITYDTSGNPLTYCEFMF